MKSGQTERFGGGSRLVSACSRSPLFALPLFGFILGAEVLSADSSITICTQNLNNFGLPALERLREKRSREEREVKRGELVARFIEANCDLIALQEIISRDPEEGEEALSKLIAKSPLGSYLAYTGESQDPLSRVGFLVNPQVAKVIKTHSYADRELPKLSAYQRPRLFSRGPFEIELELVSGERKGSKLRLITFHFKSKYGSASDPVGRGWETYRMEIAEKLREIALSRVEEQAIPTLLLGDRNSTPDSASAKILTGILELQDFQELSGCMVSKGGIPYCPMSRAKRTASFTSVFDVVAQRVYKGSHNYRGKYHWIDDILYYRGGSRASFTSTRLVSAGAKASDHALLATTIKFNE